MKPDLNNKSLERYSRQIILKDIGIVGQRKILKSKVLIVGLGGLGCPVADYLTRSGVGNLGVLDFDSVNLSNIHRQSLFYTSDLGKHKVDVVYKKLKKINSIVKIKKHKIKISKKNVQKVLKDYDIIIDGSDNFKTKFLLNEAAIKLRKYFISGSISKFDGHIFTFNFKKKKEPCLKCFYQSMPSDNIMNCETEGILGPIAGIVGNIQANEALKVILDIGKNLSSNILIIDLKDLSFRKVKFVKKKPCVC